MIFECIDLGDPPDLNEQLGEDGGRTSDEHITGLEAMLNPNQELALIDNETLEVFLKNGLSSGNQPETNSRKFYISIY